MQNKHLVQYVSLWLILLASCQSPAAEVQEPTTASEPTAQPQTVTEPPQATATMAPTELPQEADGVQLGEEFVLERGETAVIANTDLTIYNDGEGSEYYDDENGNEVHIYNIKLIVNDEIVWLDDNTPEVVVGDYVIQWQVNNRLRVIAHEAEQVHL